MAMQMFVNLPVKGEGALHLGRLLVRRPIHGRERDPHDRQWRHVGHAPRRAILRGLHRPQEVADTSRSREVIVGLSADSRQQVDELTDKALAAGANELGEPQGEGFHVHARLPRPRRASMVIHPHGYVRDPTGLRGDP